MIQTVKITISSELPQLRHILFKKEECEVKTTWENFLRSRGVKLDSKRYIIVAKNKVKSFMHKRISSILDSYTRKTSLTVLIDICSDNRKPNGNKKSKKNHMSNCGLKNRGKDSTEFPMPLLTPVIGTPPQQVLPNVKMFFGAGTSSIIHESTSGSGLRTFESSENYADIDDGDGLSQLSQDEDANVEDPMTICILKNEMKMAIERIPNTHILLMQDEVRSLRNSGGGRDYKWSHYCPRISAWIFSVFKA